jgi:hypothetical protein
MTEWIPVTGCKIVDDLRDTQRALDPNDDPSTREALALQAAANLGADALRGQYLLVDTNMALGYWTGDASELPTTYDYPLSFIGEVAEVGYCDEGIVPVSSLALDFKSPLRSDLPPEENEFEDFSRQRLIVPVLAINRIIPAQ